MTLVPLDKAPARGSSVRSLRRANGRLLLDLLRRHGPQTRAALAEATSMTPQGVAQIAADLVAEGLVLEVAPDPAAARRRGRPPVQLAFNPEASATVAVVVERGIWHVAVADGLGRDRVRRTVLDRPTSPSGVVEDLAATVLDLLRGEGVDLHRLSEVVLVPGGAPGDVALLQLAGVELDRLAAALGAPVRSLSAPAAVAFGATAASSDGDPPAALAVLDVGPDLAFAVVLDGSLVVGGRGPAGGIGHCAVPGHDRPCRCGRRGCLSTMFEPETIGHLHRAAGGSGQVSGVRDLARGAAAGDAAARAVLDELVAWAGYAGAVLASCHDLDAVVFTGVAADLGGPDRQLLAATLTRLAAPGARPRLATRVQRADVDALLAGAVAAGLGTGPRRALDPPGPN
ncbi:MAG: ROK family protein [Acidimicrobiia bacterium]|nr:ROK family protein [Acidimicrobiia bacterium]